MMLWGLEKYMGIHPPATGEKKENKWKKNLEVIKNSKKMNEKNLAQAAKTRIIERKILAGYE